MKLTAGASIAAPRDVVFAALVDPDVLRRIIPGCEDLLETAPGTFQVRLQVGVGGLKGRYTGSVVLRDRRPPASFTMSFEGKGSPGFVRGTAEVRLASEDENLGEAATSEGAATHAGTRVGCDADVQVGGVIASVGSRLVDAVARKLADDFFRRLAAEIIATARASEDAPPRRT